MNKIFKVVWNYSLQTWVAVSEFAKSHKKKSCKTESHSVCPVAVGRKSTLALMVGLALSYMGSAYAIEGFFHVNPGDGVRYGFTADNNFGYSFDPAGALERESLAAGIKAQAKGRASTAVGMNAWAESQGSIALGWNSRVQKEANANSVNSIAIGNSSIVKQGRDLGSSNSIAIGTKAEVTGQKSVAIGNLASVDAYRDNQTSGIAIGDVAKVKAKNSVAIGHKAFANDLSYKKSDFDNKESQGSAVALGDQSEATNNYAVAIGTKANAQGYGSLAISYRSKALGQYTLAFGADATAGKEANGEQSFGEIALGSHSQATGFRSLAIGLQAKSLGQQSVVIGELTEAGADAKQATAIGYKAKVSKEGAMAVGRGTTASELNSLAMGFSSKAGGKDSAAIGSNAVTKDANAIAMGNAAIASDEGAVAIGQGSIAGDAAKQAAYADAYKRKEQEIYDAAAAQATGDDAKKAAGEKAVADNMADILQFAADAIVGYTNKNQVAVGTGAYADLNNSVALGSGSKVTNGTKEEKISIAGQEYDFAGELEDTGLSQVVSVGGGEIILNDKDKTVVKIATRQIQNVASGRISKDSTDAINGSQLHAVIKAMTPATVSVTPAVGNPATTLTVDADGVVSTPVNGGQGSSAEHTPPEDNKLVNAKTLATTINAAIANHGFDVYKGELPADGNNPADKATDVTENAPSKIKAKDKLVFANGVNTTSKVKTKDGVTFVTYDVNKSADFTQSTDPKNTGDIVGATGYVFATAEQVAKAINMVGGTTDTLKTANNVDTENTDYKSYTGDTDAGFAMKANAANEIKLGATSDLTVVRKGDTGEVVYGLADNIALGKKNSGAQPDDGIDGSVTVTGKNDNSVKLDGENGTITAKNKDESKKVEVIGKDGTVKLTDGQNSAILKADEKSKGVDGKTDVERISIGGNKAATLKDGLQFTGNNSDTVNNHELNSLVSVVGEGVDKANADKFQSALGNINVLADGKNTLTVKLSRQLKDLETANFVKYDDNGQPKANTTTTNISNEGIVINKPAGADAAQDPAKTVKLTVAGLDNGGNKVINVAKGIDNTDAVNVSQLNEVVNQAVNNINNQIVSAKTEVESTDGSVNIEERQGANRQTIYDLTVTQSNLNASIDKKTVLAGTKGSAFATAENVANAINKATAAATTEVTSNNGSVSILESRGANGQNIYDLEVAKATLKRNDKGNVVSDHAGDAFVTGKNVAYMINSATAASKTEVTGSGLVFVSQKDGDNSQIIYNVDVAKADKPTVARGLVTVAQGDEKKVMVAGDIAEAINGSEKTSSVKAGSKAVTVKAGREDDKGNTEYTVDISTDNTIGRNTDGKMTVNTGNSLKVDTATGTINVNTDGTTIVVDQTTGAVKANTTELVSKDDGKIVDLQSPNSLVSAQTVAKAINKIADTVNNYGINLQANSDTPDKIKSGDTVRFVEGKNIGISRTGATVTVATKDNVDFAEVKSNAVEVKEGGKLTIGGNSAIDMGNNVVSNVADGKIAIQSKEAVNGGQLYQINQAVTNIAGDINRLGNNVRELSNIVNNMDKDLRAGVAGANAAAGLPQVYIPGKSMVAVSAGHYRGQNAIAVGYSTASDNGKMILKLQGNANTQGQVGGSVGFGYQW